MPTLPMNECLVCRMKIPAGRSWCPAHKPKPRFKQGRRPQARRIPMRPRWRAIRDAVLRNHPVCEECRRTTSSLVHHIVDRRDGGTDNPENLQALCWRCHSQKTARSSLVKIRARMTGGRGENPSGRAP